MIITAVLSVLSPQLLSHSTFAFGFQQSPPLRGERTIYVFLNNGAPRDESGGRSTTRGTKRIRPHTDYRRRSKLAMTHTQADQLEISNGEKVSGLSSSSDSLRESTFQSSSTSEQQSITSVLLRISYDGGRFTGWSAANSGNINSNSTQPQQRQPRLSKRQRRRGVTPDLPKGFVRPVEGILRTNLAKLYGNVDPERIGVEGCSRTDKGVHAQAMMAQVYCLTEDAQKQLLAKQSTIDDNDENEPTEPVLCFSIPGKRKPHPTSSTDNSFFEPSPMDGNLSRMAFALNRMLPADVRITGIAPTPDFKQQRDHRNELPFHPSQHAMSKTYEYKISVGGMHDPTQWKFVWHIDNAPSGKLDVEAMDKACQLLQGTHNYAAFQGSPRGSDDKRRREQRIQEGLLSEDGLPLSTVCTLTEIGIRQLPSPLAGVATNNIIQSSSARAIMSAPSSAYFHRLEPQLRTYTITVTGNRFLYKMVRFLVGSLVAVGMGQLNLADIEQALETGCWNEILGGNEDDIVVDDDSNRESPKRKQFQCAPPHGLVLKHVDYGSDVSIDWKPLWY